jgi:sodium/proline symporter
MTVALVAVVLYGVHMAGGMDVVVANAQALPGYLSLTESYVPSTGGTSGYGFLPIVSTLAWGLGYFGMPHILLRFMAIEDKEKLTLSRRVASVWVVISMAVAILIGVVGYSVSKAGVMEMLESSNSENVVIKIAELISRHGVAAALLAGVILAGILASVMSTADSQLLAAASSFSQNLLQDVLGVKLTAKSAMRWARCAVVGISLVAVFLARDPNSSVFRIVSFAWAGFGAAFGPVVLFSLFWRRSNKWGALAGMVTGGAVVFLWKYLVRPLGGAWDIYELLPAFLAASAAIVVVSLLTKAPSDAVTADFDAVGKM